ncbi:MAG: glycosyltransferase family 9 protein [Alphaproteobacteria bacterium]
MKTILVIKHGALGDMIFAMGAFKAIRDHHSDDKVILLTSSPFKALAEKSPYFDEVWIDDRKRPWQHPLECLSLFRTLKAANFSIVYDLQRSRRTRRYFHIMKRFFSSPPLWNGIFEGSDFHYDIPSVYVDHILKINENQIKKAGIKNVPSPDLSWLKTDISHITLPKKYFLLVPGTSPGQGHKKWPAPFYGQVAQYIWKKGCTPVVLGTAQEQSEYDEIYKSCPNAISLLGKTTLFDIPEIARHAQGALGNDTGPMHLCYFSGCPSLYLFSYSSGVNLCGPTDGVSKVLKKESLRELTVNEVIKNLVFKS